MSCPDDGHDLRVQKTLGDKTAGDKTFTVFFPGSGGDEPEDPSKEKLDRNGPVPDVAFLWLCTTASWTTGTARSCHTRATLR